ncbi:hypothetical protein [Streptomyces sp. NPDC002644]
MRMLIRAAMTGAAVLAVTAASATSASAAAQTNANGTFYFSGLLGGAGQINNPTLGPCYVVDLLSLSGTNNTDAVATVYSDISCVLQGFRINPGNSFNNLQYASIKFSAVE